MGQSLRTHDGKMICEQIDGAIEIDGMIYIVEMKWWANKIDKAEVADHMVRVFSRSGGGTRGLYISYSGYTPPAIESCKEHLGRFTLLLSDLSEYITALEQRHDIKEMIKKKFAASQLDKNPYYKPF